MENLGARFEPGTEIGSIAPNDEVEAVILIGQEHLPDLAVDQSVRLTMDDAPGKVIRSKVTQFSWEAEVFAPPGLSLKYGGTMATAADAAGRERLTSRAFKILAPLGPDVPGVQIGMRGKARITISEYSRGEWMWRYLRQTFHFRI